MITLAATLALTWNLGAMYVGRLGPVCCAVPFGLFGLALFAFWLWMLIDCIQNEPSEGNDKIIWILVIVLTTWIGALIYYFVRKNARGR